jgi:hypothetical protein
VTEERDMTPYINTQLLLDRVNGRTISTVKLASEHARVNNAAYETTIFNNSRTQFLESGPFYWQTEEEARQGHEGLKTHEELHMAHTNSTPEFLAYLQEAYPNERL